tara:strand:- start:1730 stop:2005 length:276 start_codon:yes stop_codon:yes gene_type:complete
MSEVKVKELENRLKQITEQYERIPGTMPIVQKQELEKCAEDLTVLLEGLRVNLTSDVIPGWTTGEYITLIQQHVERLVKISETKFDSTLFS